MRRLAALRAGLYALTALVALGLATPLLALAAPPEHAEPLGRAALILGGLVAVVAAAFGLVLPASRWRRDDAVARLVGRRAPVLASDLLSAVELERPLEGARGEVSNQLVGALAQSTADRLRVVELGTLFPARALRPAGLAAGIGGLVALAAVIAAGGTLAGGWRRALSTARPIGPLPGARLAYSPIVGDLAIRLDFPPYTQRPPLVLPSAAGDFRALPGTQVTLETAALVEANAAQVSFDGGAPPAVAMTVDGRKLGARFTVIGPAAYRFVLEPPRGARIVEAEPHLIEIEPDRPPKVDLYAPAAELDVTAHKRIELAYSAEDDFGVAALDLVWDPGSGGKPGRMPLPAIEPGTRLAQGKTLWDLAEVSLPPGARVAYHLEARDNNAVGEAGVAVSQTYYLKVYSPRERHARLIERQQEMFEHLVALLAGRLVVPVEDLPAHRGLHRDTEALVVALGGLVVELREDKLAAKELLAALGEVQKRLERLARDEAALLGELGERPARPPAKLGPSDKKQVAELEHDVLLLSDWLDRQRMEDLLSITDEIAGHKDRLKELLEEYARTGDPAVRNEIEREMRALEQRLAELEQRRQKLAGEVLDRFVNNEAMQEQATESCLAEVRRLLDAGKVAAAQAKLESCSKLLDQGAQALEESLRALRGDKFSEQEARFGELMNELSDLAQDQKEIADETDRMFERYAERVEEFMEDESRPTRAAADQLLDKLRKRLARVPRQGLTPFSADELAVVDSRLADVDRMLGDGDLAEALAMARQAEASLETIEADLGTDLDQGEPWNDKTPEAYNEIARSLPLAHELVELLENATPAPDDMMSAEDRRRLSQLRRRQQAARERAKRLGQRSKEQAGNLPGESGQQLAERIGAAEQHMGRADERMRGSDPAGARQEARSAYQKLTEARERGQQAARQGQVEGNRGLRDEPVRIPGAEDYKAPKRFREDILEAMKKEKAPAGFAEQVKRYYEELIR